jgi:hypothetical protein
MEFIDDKGFAILKTQDWITTKVLFSNINPFVFEVGNKEGLKRQFSFNGVDLYKKVQAWVLNAEEEPEEEKKPAKTKAEKVDKT